MAPAADATTAGGPPRTRRLPFGPALAILAGLALAAGYALHDACAHGDLAGGLPYERHCYTDATTLWSAHHLDRGAVPFLQEPNEYPVLTALLMWGTAVVANSAGAGLGVAPQVAFAELTFILLTLAGAAVTWILWRLRLPPERLLAWALGPPLVIHGLVNWDLLAVLAATAGWLAWRRERPFTAALLFGLGGAAKLYPAFFLPFLFLSVLRARDVRRAWRVAAGGLAGLALPNLLVALAAFANWRGSWLFQAQRPPDPGSIWSAAVQPLVEALVGPLPEAAWVRVSAYAGAVAVAAALWMLARRVWRGRLDPLAAGGLLTIAFLLVNKVYSPQYTLWVVPILLILEARWLPLLLFLAADLANYLALYRFLSPASPHGNWLAWTQVAVTARWAFLLWCAISILVRLDVVVAWRLRGPLQRLLPPRWRRPAP